MAFTKIVSPGIDTTGSYTVRDLNAVGVLTASAFSGPLTGNATGLTGTPDIAVANITATGNVSIGGTLTYEDVTNVDSIGIVTARNGLHVTSGSVGIGTDNPATDFHIHSPSSGSNSEILLTNGDTGSSATDGFKIALNTGSGGEIWNYENDYIRFGTNNDERLRITSAGLVKVGGNETVPAATGIQIENAGAALLTLLRNDLTISDGNTLGGIDFYGNDGGSVQQVAKISAVADGTHGDNDKPTALVFQTTNDGSGSATEKLRITNAGNIGVGVANPTQESGTGLHIRGASGGQTRIHLTNSATGDTATDGFYIISQGAESGGASGEVMLQQKENKALKFATNNTERLRIDSNGRVSINDNSRPASDASEGAQLRVTGTPITRNQYYSPAGDYFGSFGYTDNTYTKSWIAVDSSYNKTSSVSSGIFLSAFHSDANGSACGHTIKNVRTDAGGLIFSSVHAASSTGNPAVETERLRITSAGQLNFGGNLTQTGFTASITRNSSETDILRIKGNGGNAFIRFEDNDASSSFTLGADDAVGSGGFALYDRSDSAYRVVVDTAGRVSINATSPAQVGGQTPYLYVASGYTNLDGLRIRGLDTGNTIWKDGGDMSLTVASNHAISLKTQSATRLSVTGGGNVGINQTDPSRAKLHVVGPSTATNEIIAKFKGGSGGDCESRIALVAGYPDNANDTEGHVYLAARRNGNGNSSSFSVYCSDGGTINERFKVTNGGHLYLNGSNGAHRVVDEYSGTTSVTGSNNESFAFEFQGSSLASGGLLYFWGTSGNVVVNVSAELLINHSADVTIKSMSGAYTQGRIRVKTDNNTRCAVYLGRSGGYGSGTTTLNWRFIPYGGTYAYTTESSNTGTDHTHNTSSGSFRITAAGGGGGNVNASGSKNFLIDHPLVGLATTTRLAHAAVEGPECNTMYRGKVDLVDGTASVNIDTNSRMTEGTFEALNQNVQCFTTNETGWTAIKGSVSGNLLTITAQDNTCTDTISWMVVGERHDQDIINNRATDSEGRFIPEIADEYDPSQFPTYPEES